MLNLINKLVTSEVSLIVISGVLIFSFQKLVSQLWISPVIDFKKCLSKIESLMNRWDFLYKYTEGKNNYVGSDGLLMDERIKLFRKELSELVFELVMTYNLLPALEKLWIRYVYRLNIKSAKSSMLILSTSVAKESDWKTGDSISEKEINNIYTYLRLSKILQG